MKWFARRTWWVVVLIFTNSPSRAGCRLPSAPTDCTTGFAHSGATCPALRLITSSGWLFLWPPGQGPQEHRWGQLLHETLKVRSKGQKKAFGFKQQQETTGEVLVGGKESTLFGKMQY